MEEQEKLRLIRSNLESLYNKIDFDLQLLESSRLKALISDFEYQAQVTERKYNMQAVKVVANLADELLKSSGK